MLLDKQIKIFEEFLRDYRAQLTGSFIAKKKGLNQKTAANYLNKLEKETILKSKTQGKNKLYTLNLDNKEIVRNFIIAAEHFRTIDFYKKNVLIREISEKIILFIKGSAIIFGSYAKNMQKRHSDLDIIVIGKADEDEISALARIYKIEISLKIYPKFKNDILMTEVLKDHIVIKNAEEFIGDVLNG
ncbi:MAG: nucleotidyltransferase domain-containing protein [Nanoarchaeota archaeon]